MNTGQAAHFYKDFTYQTRDSWSRPRRAVGKAKDLAKLATPLGGDLLAR